MKLLIVEDHHNLIDAMVKSLEQEQFLCETAMDFETAHEKIHLYSYDILVVDINLPDGTGLNLIREVKKVSPDAGIIVVSARNSVDNKVEGLALGADDYLTKPFDMAELVARIKSLIRRRNFSGNPTISFGSLLIDPVARELTANGQKVDLTRTEFQILLFFASSPGRVISRDSLAEHIWGDHMDLADSYDFIYSHIKNLRKKITATGAGDPIKAVYGIGYKFEVQWP